MERCCDTPFFSSDKSRGTTRKLQGIVENPANAQCLRDVVEKRKGITQLGKWGRMKRCKWREENRMEEEVKMEGR